MRAHTEVEMMVNAEGAVAIFMPPTKIEPDSCKIDDGVVTVVGLGDPLAKFLAPETFISPLEKTAKLLVVECLPTGTTRETIVELA